tara:strand:- start:257 stop:721 length:465 start_codon:yes stop_codon:yes gene_type:complete
MFASTVTLFVIALLTIGIGFYWAIANYHRHKANVAIAAELDAMLHSTIDMVKRAQKYKNPNTQEALSELYSPLSDGKPNLESPAMLSTLLTVLVHKYGSVRLSLKDFALPEEEYVSVYVDTTTQDLILSGNHQLTSKHEHSLLNFTDSDDNTFH